MHEQKRSISTGYRKAVLLLLVFTLFLFSGLQAYSLETADEEEDTFPVYYNGKRTSYTGYYYRGNIYLTPECIQKYGDCSRLTFDTENRKVRFEIGELNFELADPELTEFVKENAGEGYIRIGSWDTKVKYVVSLQALEGIIKLSGYLDRDNGKILLSPYEPGKTTVAEIMQETVFVPSFETFRSEPVTLKQGTPVTITGETDHYYKIITTSGLTGYVMKAVVQEYEKDLTGLDFYAPKRSETLDTDTPFSASWVSVSLNTSTMEITEKYDGLDILCPTWTRLCVEEGGACYNDSDAGFIRMARLNGYKIWGTVTNNFSAKGSSNFTYKMLGDTEIRNRTLAQYLFYACYYGWDGINVDFEQIEPLNPTNAETKETAALFVSFIEELADYTTRQGLTLSVDVPTVEDWYTEYDFEKLGEAADYITVMTYDQHVNSSSSAGSVADLAWTESSLKELLKLVPAEKVVLGIPFYSRIYVTSSASLKNKSGVSVSMSSLKTIIEEMDVTPTWLTKEKQYYAEWPENNGDINRVWMETSRSLAYRLKLVQDYGLAGSSVWQFSQADPEIWEEFDAMLHKGESYETYDTEY